MTIDDITDTGSVTLEQIGAYVMAIGAFAESSRTRREIPSGEMCARAFVTQRDPSREEWS